MCKFEFQDKDQCSLCQDDVVCGGVGVFFLCIPVCCYFCSSGDSVMYTGSWRPILSFPTLYVQYPFSDCMPIWPSVERLVFNLWPVMSHHVRNASMSDHSDQILLFFFFFFFFFFTFTHELNG